MAKIMTKRFFVVGNKGKIVGVYDNSVDASRHGKGETPIFELMPAKMMAPEKTMSTFTYSRRGEQKIVMELAQKFYRKCKYYGPYGDVIQISRHHAIGLKNGYTYVVDSMMWRAHVKPGMAADLVLFVRDNMGSLFFVGIIRGKNPGKGKIALAGGFIDANGFYMETAAQCSVREAKEELGVKIFPARGKGKDFFIPNERYLNVEVTLAGMNILSKLCLVGTYFTSDEENLIDIGLKRVHQTTAYMIVIPVDDRLTTESVVDLFPKGDHDDAAGITAIPFYFLPETEFAFKHHRTICSDASKAIINSKINDLIIL
ncbi:MAG: NUDIX domain-containing protein [Candidatus Moraniibacteriota bacterium]